MFSNKCLFDLIRGFERNCKYIENNCRTIDELKHELTIDSSNTNSFCGELCCLTNKLELAKYYTEPYLNE